MALEYAPSMLAHLLGGRNPDQQLRLILPRGDISRGCSGAMSCESLHSRNYLARVIMPFELTSIKFACPVSRENTKYEPVPAWYINSTALLSVSAHPRQSGSLFVTAKTSKGAAIGPRFHERTRVSLPGPVLTYSGDEPVIEAEPITFSKPPKTFFRQPVIAYSGRSA